MTFVTPTQTAPSNGFVFSHLLLCSFLWATSFIFIKLTVGAVPPLVIAAIRGILGAACLAIWFQIRRESILPKRGEWKIWLVLGALNGWIPNILVAFALGKIPASQGAMIQASGPLMTALLAHAAFAEERLSWPRLLGILVGFGGVALIIGPQTPSFDGVTWAILAMIVTTLCYALGSIFVRSLKRAVPSRLALGQQVFSGVPAVIFALICAGPSAFTAVPGHALPLLGLGVIGTAMPIVIFMNLIRKAGPTRASLTGYLIPAWATLLAISLLGEMIGPREMIGGAIVLLGVYLVSTAKVAPRALWDD